MAQSRRVFTLNSTTQPKSNELSKYTNNRSILIPISSSNMFEDVSEDGAPCQ